ncbi:MAG: hypothetical protein GF398_08475 [Chitinivibrionales bacterium]|nr:hypothetical protein [Chitinivibrionales bacterium]
MCQLQKRSWWSANLSVLIACAVTICLANEIVFSQSSDRCDLVSKMETGQNYRRCVSLKDLSDTLYVPESVTRISKDGLAICPRIFPQISPADIVYIVDQSGSMGYKGNNGNYSHPTIGYLVQNGDTLFCESGCNGSGNMVTFPYEEGTKDLPLCTSCNDINTSGDPLQQRANAIKVAIQKQAAWSPTSTAGYLDFGNAVSKHIAPVTLGDQSNINSLMNSIILQNLSSTHYRQPLDSAKRWLDPTSQWHRNEKKVIIFLTDGRPTHLDQAANQYNELLEPGLYPFPTVFGIFLGTDSTIADSLISLTGQTNGEFFMVPPSQPDSLEGVIEAILAKVLQAPNADISITNKTLSQNSISLNQATHKERGVTIDLDSVVALDPDQPNQVEFVMTHSSGDIESFEFTVIVTDDQSKQTDFNAYFTQDCNASSIKFLDENGNYVTQIEDGSTFQVELYTYNSGLSVFNPVFATGLNDYENIRIAKTSHTHDSTNGLTLRKLLTYDHSASSASTNNGKLEVKPADRIAVSWVHPRDPLDTVYAELSVVKSDIPQIAATKAVMYDQDRDGRADSLVITFDQKAPEKFQATNTYWNKGEPSMERTQNVAKLSSDSLTITFSFAGNQFNQDLTGIDPTEKAPYTRLKSTGTAWALKTDTIHIQDGMGPVPVSALLSKSPAIGSDPDTIILTVSERLSTTGSDPWKKMLRFASSNTYSSSDLLTVAKSPAQTGLVYKIPIDKNSDVKAGDYLFLNTGGPYTDSARNNPGEKGVKLSLSTQLYFALESDLDSAISTIAWPAESQVMAVVLTDATDDSLLLNLQTENNDLETFTMKKQGGKFTAKISISFVDPAKSGNGVVEGKPVSAAGANREVITGTVGTRVDSASATVALVHDLGVYIETAKYYPGALPDQPNQGHPDTLRLQLSEEIQSNSLSNAPIEELFAVYVMSQDKLAGDHLKSSPPVTYSYDSNDQIINLFIPRAVSNPDSAVVTIVPTLDGIEFKSGIPYALDTNDNPPASDKRVTIQWGVDFAPAPQILSPLVIGETNNDQAAQVLTRFKDILSAAQTGLQYEEYPADMKQKITELAKAQYGTPVKVTSLLRLKPQKSSYMIYDPVGNLVVDNMPLVRGGSTNNYYSLWDGRNSNGRHVGTGTYLVIFNLVDENDKAVAPVRAKVGVKK